MDGSIKILSSTDGRNSIINVSSNIMQFYNTGSYNIALTINFLDSSATFGGNITTTGTINGVTVAELGYLNGVTSAIQTQLNNSNIAITNGQKNSIYKPVYIIASGTTAVPDSINLSNCPITMFGTNQYIRIFVFGTIDNITFTLWSFLNVNTTDNTVGSLTDTFYQYGSTISQSNLLDLTFSGTLSSASITFSNGVFSTIRCETIRFG